MAAYHQMGHDSWNLVGEDALRSFSGLVLSPVNSGPKTVIERLKSVRDGLDIVLDPHFYKPTSDRGCLPEWAHFSDALDTTDIGDGRWWHERCEQLAIEAARIGATSIASPSIIPRTFDAAYYDWAVNCAEMLDGIVGQERMSVLITGIVRVSEIGQPGAAERIASLLTRTSLQRVYLVLYDDIPPRTQRTDSGALAGAMRLISAIEEAGSRTLVAFAGLDMLLWKAAGATHVATGKFFNVRRFVPGRFDEPLEGGRQLPYWTHDDYITWMREDDVRLLLRIGLFNREHAIANPYSRQILEILDSNSGAAWVGLGWRQYMYWFAQQEAEIAAGRSNVRDILVLADRKWSELETSGALLFDRINNGEWVRAWLNALLLAQRG